MIGRNLNFAQAEKLAFYDINSSDASKQWSMLISRGFIKDNGLGNKYALTQAGQNLIRSGLDEAYQNGSNATGDHAEDENQPQQVGMQAAPAPGAHVATPANPPAPPAAAPAPAGQAQAAPQQASAAPAPTGAPQPPQPAQQAPKPATPAAPAQPNQTQPTAPNANAADLNTAKTIAAKLKSQPNYDANNIDTDVGNEMNAMGKPQNTQNVSALVKQQMGVQESRKRK